VGVLAGARSAAVVRIVRRAGEYVALRLHTECGLKADRVALSGRGPTEAILEVLAPAVLGAQPADIEAVAQRMLAAGYLIGAEGVKARARSLIEICLRDSPPGSASSRCGQRCTAGRRALGR
jgi:L-alanine-DL-glutamate epimerase-like enolase superfamily enzyme